LVDACAESLHIEVGEVFGISRRSFVSLLVDINFEGVAFPHFLVEGGDGLVGILLLLELNVSKSAGGAIIEA